MHNTPPPPRAAVAPFIWKTTSASCAHRSAGSALGSGILTGFFGYGPGGSDDYIYSIGFLFLNTITSVSTSTDKIDTSHQAPPDWTYVNSLTYDNRLYSSYSPLSFSYEKVEGYTATYSEESTKSTYFGAKVAVSYSYTATQLASEQSFGVSSLSCVTFCQPPMARSSVRNEAATSRGC